MKKILALLLAAAMLLSMTACGGSAEPAETAPATTELAVVETEATTEATTEAPAEEPTEDPNAYTVYTLGESESYEKVLWNRGFWEVDMNACVKEAAIYNTKGGQATPLSLELSQNGFRMEVDYTGYDIATGKVIPYGTVELIGTTAEQLGDISGIDSKDYQFTGSSYTIDQNGVKSDYFAYADGYVQSDCYWYYNEDSTGATRDLVYVAATYYTSTDRLYNIIYHVPDGVDDRGEPFLLYHVDSQYPYSPFYAEVETLTYGDFTFEMSQFAIQCGDKRYVYNYRPGMSLSDWACSELNTDGWIPWYGDAVLSPDRAYIGDTGYLDMQGSMDWYNCGNLLVAKEYDGSVNKFNNSYTGTSISDVTPITGNTSGMSIDLTDEEALKELLAQLGVPVDGSSPIITVPDGTTVGSLTGDVVADMMGTEENEIKKYGNISVTVAHLVNARTPLFTPGFRIVGKKDARAAYHSVEMNDALLLDDILDIYMNGIADELIPHIKLYAFPESEEFMETLEGHTIFNAHPTPLEQGNKMLTIPENAVCLTFQRVRDGKEAPGTPYPYKPGHENLNEDAVYTRYITKDDPNFGEGVNLVFAITFDDELVYWIHMGANFSESVEIEVIQPLMRY